MQCITSTVSRFLLRRLAVLQMKLNNLSCNCSGFLIPIILMLHSDRTRSADSDFKSIDLFLYE